MSRRAALVAGGTLLAVTALFVGLALRLYIDALPPLDMTSAEARSAVVLDRDGRLLRPFATADGRWRLPLDPKDVDPRYLAMLEAYEDGRFARHVGVDPFAMARAAWQWLRAGAVRSGGSTLSMQVARLIEPRRARTLGAKLRQIVRAVQLERRYGKDGVLRLYLALAPFGGAIEGVRAASLAYFGREPTRLSPAEAALLVALPQAPTLRRPDRHPDAAARARGRVLARAVDSGLLTPEDATLAAREPVPAARVPFPMLAAHAAEEASTRAPATPVHRLTLDRTLQANLERLARDSVVPLPGLSCAIVVVDNGTGEVRARVGSAGYLDASRAGAIDMTRALRSPGSALKPFVYAMAFDAGLAHPETLVEDRPTRFGGSYAPENFDLSFQGTISARRALQLSLNIPAVEMLDAVGAARFVAGLRSAGAILTLPRDTAPGLPVILGGLGISLGDLARLYAGLARGGAVPDLVWRATDAGPRPDKRIVEPVAAWYVADILRGAPPPDNALAGRIAFKTGTSYGYRDAWAAGFDRRVTIAVWVGRPDGGAVPGLVGRAIAAPILFDAFSRYGGIPEHVAMPPGALLAGNAGLPAALRQLRKDLGRTATLGGDQPLRIAFPPDGARLELGLAAGSAADVALKAVGGRPPLVWMVDNAPVTTGERRQAAWHPDGAGFARISVIDAAGATDSIRVRLE